MATHCCHCYQSSPCRSHPYTGLVLIANYLSQRRQHDRVNFKYSEWEETGLGIPQGSVLDPLLFSIHINNFLFAMKSSDVCNFTDDNTVYACGKDVESVARRHEDYIPRTPDWFQHDRMVVNPKKVQAMFLDLKQHKKFLLEIRNKTINMTRSVKLLGITFDDEMKFDKHMETFSESQKKASVLILPTLSISL